MQSVIELSPARAERPRRRGNFNQWSRWQRRSTTLALGALGRWAVVAPLLLATTMGTAGAQSGPGLGAAPTLQATDPSERGDGTISEAARRALSEGPLPASAGDRAAKAAANRAAARAALAPPLAADRRAAGAPVPDPRAPSVLDGRNFPGQLDPGASPSDATGAIGPERYLQLINRRFAIYPRSSNTPLAAGTLQAARRGLEHRQRLRPAGHMGSHDSSASTMSWTASTRRPTIACCLASAGPRPQLGGRFLHLRRPLWQRVPGLS